MAKRCICSLASNTVGTGICIGTTALGAAIGTAIFPAAGTLIGAFIGFVAGIIVSIAAGVGIDYLGDKFVDDQKEFTLLE